MNTRIFHIHVTHKSVTYTFTLSYTHTYTYTLNISINTSKKVYSYLNTYILSINIRWSLPLVLSLLQTDTLHSSELSFSKQCDHINPFLLNKV